MIAPHLRARLIRILYRYKDADDHRFALHSETLDKLLAAIAESAPRIHIDTVRGFPAGIVLLESTGPGAASESATPKDETMKEKIPQPAKKSAAKPAAKAAKAKPAAPKAKKAGKK